MSNLSAPHFHYEEKAYEYVEARLWPNGPVCPHCGGVDRVGKLQGKTTRPGLWKCYQCRKPFTVKLGTIFEDSKVPMRLWLQAMYLIAGSKKGISSNHLHRILGVTLKTAWFMSHRIREAMQGDDFGQLGGLGATVEADETYIGRVKGRAKDKGFWHKMKVLALVERGGSSRAVVVKDITIPTVQPIVLENVHRLSKFNTDEAQHYRSIGRFFYQHGTVNHMRGEYGRGPVHTNTIEGYFSIFKRGMKGVYQHCAEKHLHRYVAEFNFRYSNRVALGINDEDRADALLKGVIGKRLTYETTGAARS